jgi:hypothetical protein
LGGPKWAATEVGAVDWVEDGLDVKEGYVRVAKFFFWPNDLQIYKKVFNFAGGKNYYGYETSRI